MAAAAAAVLEGRPLSVKSFRRMLWLPNQNQTGAGEGAARATARPPSNYTGRYQVKPSGGGREPECCRPASAGCSSSYKVPFVPV